MAYKLLHAHGNAGPKGKRSYLSFGTFKNKKNARKEARERDLDGSKIVPASRVKKSTLKGSKGLYYISR